MTEFTVNTPSTEHDRLLVRGKAWKSHAFFSFAKARTAKAGIAVSTSVLANVVAYAMDPLLIQERLLARNTVSKYRKIWEEICEGGESLFQQVDRALEAYLAGDDSLLKAVTPERKEWVLVEVGKQIQDRFGASHPEFRARKFHNPMYLTPAGFIQAFPETDEDSFIDYEMASLAVERYRQMLPEGSTVRVTSLKRGRQIHASAFRRWVQEVKGVDGYKEPRRDLRESYNIYADGGTEALKRLYSPGYVFMLMRKFKQKGWLDESPSLAI